MFGRHGHGKKKRRIRKIEGRASGKGVKRKERGIRPLEEKGKMQRLYDRF